MFRFLASPVHSFTKYPEPITALQLFILAVCIFLFPNAEAQNAEAQGNCNTADCFQSYCWHGTLWSKAEAKWVRGLCRYFKPNNDTIMDFIGLCSMGKNAVMYSQSKGSGKCKDEAKGVIDAYESQWVQLLSQHGFLSRLA
jgi:hypothetical protein